MVECWGVNRLDFGLRKINASIIKNDHLESGCEGATFESKPFMTSY